MDVREPGAWLSYDIARDMPGKLCAFLAVFSSELSRVLVQPGFPDGLG